MGVDVSDSKALRSLSFQTEWVLFMAQTPSSTYLLVTNPELS